MLDTEIKPVLESVLEPPPLNHVDRAFTQLFDDGFYSLPSDDGILTSLGR